MLAENWLPVVTHPDRYEVSDQGRVRTKERVITRGCVPPFLRPPKILAQTIGGQAKNYKRVMLMSPQRHAYVHHLMAEAFIGPRPPGEQVLHKDDDGFHNRIDNLRYGTEEENKMDIHVARVAKHLEPAPF
jgi:hypothetical protein